MSIPNRSKKLLSKIDSEAKAKMDKRKKTKKRRSRTRTERNDVEDDRIPFRSFKVNVMGTCQSFEFRDCAREDMGLDRLTDMIRTNLRLKGDEIIDILWSEDACTPMSLSEEKKFKCIWDRLEFDENGWSQVYMQVLESSKDGDEPCETVPPHKYMTPIKKTHPKKPISKKKYTKESSNI